MARSSRQPPPQSLHHGGSSATVRRRAKRQRAPKKARRGRNLTAILHAYVNAVALNNCSEHTKYAAKAFITAHGSAHPCDLTTTHVLEAFALGRHHSPGTRYAWSVAFKQILRFLQEEHGAPPLVKAVPKVSVPVPRAVTITAEEKRRIIDASPPDLKLWLLLCSDLALRSSTAARIAPKHFNAEERTITFDTKFGTQQTLPVTQAIVNLFAAAGSNPNPEIAYVSQLSRLGRVCAPHLRVRFNALRRSLGITRSLTPHDLRRTTAVRTLEVTKDLRIVQALLGHKELATTLWYLDHRNTPVELSTLELAKLPTATEVKQ